MAAAVDRKVSLLREEITAAVDIPAQINMKTATTAAVNMADHHHHIADKEVRGTLRFMRRDHMRVDTIRTQSQGLTIELTAGKMLLITGDHHSDMVHKDLLPVMARKVMG